MDIKRKPLKAQRHLSTAEIEKHLRNVEYIIMAAPAVRDDAKGPIHFTIFLNTPNLPDDVRRPILDRFAAQYGIRGIEELLMQPAQVAFAETTQDTPMPLFLFTPEDRMRLPSVTTFVMDFEADSDNFPEVKEQQLTGWTYAYE